MCSVLSYPTVGWRYVSSADYFAEAKKRNRELKKLKSVSRGYRKAAVRAVKLKALRLKTIDDIQAADRRLSKLIEWGQNEH